MATVECQIIDIAMRLSHSRTRLPKMNTSPYKISQEMNGFDSRDEFTRRT
jgi:hypothetical protein